MHEPDDQQCRRDNPSDPPVAAPRGGRVRRSPGRLASAEIIAPALCLALTLIAGAWPNGFFETSRNWLFDTYQRLAPAHRGVPHTVVIDIDAESIQRIGQWPWPRDRLAALIDAANPARVIGVDLLLSEPDRASPENWVADQAGLAPQIREALRQLPSNDARLARSIVAAPVVMAAVAVPRAPPEQDSTVGARPLVEIGPDPRRELPAYGGVLRPLPQLAGAASGLGIVTMPPEPDGILRRVPAIVAAGGELLPGLATEILRRWIGAERIEVHGSAAGIAEISLAGKVLPTDNRGRVWPRYSRLPPARYVPAYAVLQGTIDPAVFRDRIVLIGVSAPGLGDVIVSPLRQPQKGIDVHAQLIESLIAGDELRRPGTLPAAELCLALLLGGLGIALLRRVPTVANAFGFTGLVLLLALGSWASFATTGLLIDWTFPAAALAATGLVALTARTRAEMRTRRQRERELEAALLQAEAADRAKTEFLANVSHELRTPLSAVIGFSEVMVHELLGPLAPNYAGYARDIHDSGKHLLGIIEDVLSLSVLDLGGARAGDEPVEVAATLAECGRMAAPRAQSRNVGIAYDVAGGLPLLRVDSRMLRQMLLNLLTNAIKYSPAGSDVTIGAGVKDGWLVISVADCGPGIAEADLANVLRPFGRLKSARLAQEPGIGIGLPLTKSMVELHGGRLEINSRLNAGTEVLLWFPPARLDQEKQR